MENSRRKATLNKKKDSIQRSTIAEGRPKAEGIGVGEGIGVASESVLQYGLACIFSRDRSSGFGSVDARHGNRFDSEQGKRNDKLKLLGDRAKRSK